MRFVSVLAHHGASIRLDSSCAQSPSWPAPMRNASVILRCDATGKATLREKSRVLREWPDPLTALRWVESEVRSQPASRWIGYLAYDLGRWFECLPSRAPDDLHLPLFAFAKFSDYDGPALPVIDAGGRPRAESRASVLGYEGPALPHSTFTRDQYLEAVSRVIEYIRAGDIFQVNLSQRFTAALSEQPIEIYERLLAFTPARYGGYLDFGDFVLVSNSPELFLRVSLDPVTNKRRVITRPIKGTRPRIDGVDQELLQSAKEQAELNMIVDLERNDLGRICEIGSVRVTEPRIIEAHPTVYHGAATVEGILRDNVSLVDLLRATFPGGSVTGAPKIRAMQIIDELEPVRRGPYCGAIGSISADRVELNVAIRTMIILGNQAHIPVGGGIVADSNPEEEYEETLVKAHAMFAAIGGKRP